LIDANADLLDETANRIDAIRGRVEQTPNPIDENAVRIDDGADRIGPGRSQSRLVTLHHRESPAREPIFADARARVRLWGARGRAQHRA
jgi:hypothetical protein